MPTPQQFQNAIVAASQAGDNEGAQVLADEYHRQYGAQQAAPRNYSLGEALMTGAGNLAKQTLGTWNLSPLDMATAGFHLATNPDARAKLAAALQAQYQHAKDVVGGYVQQVRDLSPPESQGSAPRMSVQPAQQAEARVVAKYGVNPSPASIQGALGGNLGQPNLNAYETAKRAVAEHPLATALAIAPFAAKGAGLVGDALDSAGISLPSLSSVGRIPAAVGNVLDAGSGAANEAVRQSALAKVLAQQQAVGEAQSAADLAKAGDVPLRAAMEDAANAQAAQGIGVSDTPEAQQLVADLQAKLNPQGPVVTQPTAQQAKAYQTIIDALTPNQAGQKPSLEMIQNTRRLLQEPTFEDPEGFKAISAITRGNLVDQLHGVENAYTGGLADPVRQNYAAFKTAQEAADEAAGRQDMLASQLTQLDNLSGAKAVTRAQAIVKGMAEKGQISQADYADFLKLANTAATAQGKASFRKRLALYAAGGIVGAEGLRVGSHIAGGFVP